MMTSKITPSKFKIFNEQTVGKNNFKPDLMYIDDSLSPKQKLDFLKIYGEDGYRFAFDVNASMKQIYKEEMDKAEKADLETYPPIITELKFFFDRQKHHPLWCNKRYKNYNEVLDNKKSSEINKSELILCLDVENDITSFKDQQIFLLTLPHLKIALKRTLEREFVKPCSKVEKFYTE